MLTMKAGRTIGRWALASAMIVGGFGIGFLAMGGLGTASAKPGDRLDRSQFVRTFSEDFDGELSWCSDPCGRQTWRTKYFHSGTTPMSRGVGIGNESGVAVDPRYLGLGINPFRIDGGILAIQVKPADARTQKAVQDAWPRQYDGPRPTPRFTAGVLTTEFSFRQLYGYFEIRAKVPALAGGWPAFWLLGQQGTHNEIDVFEILTGRPGTHYLGHQWGRIDVDKKQSARSETRGDDLSRDFHLFGVLWSKNSIVYYRDDIEIARFDNKGLFDPMYMIVNVAMDGDWNAKEGFRATPDATGDLLVDYVRAYSVPDDR